MTSFYMRFFIIIDGVTTVKKVWLDIQAKNKQSLP